MLVVDSSIFLPQIVHVLGLPVIFEREAPAWKSVLALVVSLAPRSDGRWLEPAESANEGGSE